MSKTDPTENVLTQKVNKTFDAVLTRTEDDITKAWKDASTPEEREACWAQLRAVAAIGEALRAEVTRELMNQAATLRTIV
jgi:hypothetical protein